MLAILGVALASLHWGRWTRGGRGKGGEGAGLGTLRQMHNKESRKSESKTKHAKKKIITKKNFARLKLYLISETRLTDIVFY